MILAWTMETSRSSCLSSPTLFVTDVLLSCFHVFTMLLLLQGDCFEVTMHRDKFPEKIPFRLTRMLTNAMEVRWLCRCVSAGLC